MTDESKQSELLEIYKLHAELADRVSQRRETANQRYSSILVGLGAFLAALLRFGDGEFLAPAVRLVSGLGMLVSFSWYIVIRSYRQLNSGKFKALHELEERLAYAFYTREWELLGKGRKISRYWKLTKVEKFLPLTFLLLSVGLFIWSFFSRCA